VSYPDGHRIYRIEIIERKRIRRHVKDQHPSWRRKSLIRPWSSAWQNLIERAEVVVLLFKVGDIAASLE